ncbi:MAG: alpha/beta hydrolase domain-containing protein [Acidobacteriota bacterium]|nr:alpha/beta hydrolase domain-containing protein [Acidobacteriota bacterium]
MRILLTVGLVFSACLAVAQTPFSGVVETAVENGRQLKGQVALTIDGKPVSKRFVTRVPVKDWNGSLVIGAHGGSGGNAVDRAGRVYATSETALDDVIGQYALANGFAYASVDRDGAISSRGGLQLTYEFADLAKAEIARLAGRAPAHTYLVGLSMGGGIARLAAEDSEKRFAGTLIIAGAGGDLVTRLDRLTKMNGLWRLIDPLAHIGMSSDDTRMIAYAAAVGTPVEARRLWPYTGSGAAAAIKQAQTATEEITGELQVPTIEVVGTWDDLVIREIRAYRLRAQPADRHRLYQVTGVWHMSGDDDGVQGFQYAADTRMRLNKDVADAMGEGPSYIPTVREAFDQLVRWVEKGASPPASQTIEPGQRLSDR